MSVAAAWGIPPRYTVYAHRVRSRLASGIAAQSAANWPFDFIDELLFAVRRGETTQLRMDTLLASLPMYRMYLDPEGPSRAWPESLALARLHAISVRDAAHLELALRTNLPLATIDPNLTRVATSAGISIFTP
jgi:predicted nucleic acid-binding protein